ncbi:MAG: hypothetical protein GC151_13810 [Betaproteobacteria bacterium]|nr:hypothetical protein [Betaproteobacteria bacterium]
MLSGARTIIAAVVAIVSQLCLLFGVDFGQVLAEHGLKIETLADQMFGAVNLLVSIGAACATVYFRFIATKRLAPTSDGQTKLQMSAATMVLAFFLASMIVGCAGMPRPAAPSNTREGIEAVDLAIQHAASTIGQITCPVAKWDSAAAKCGASGFPIAPVHGLSLLDRLDELHGAVGDAKAIAGGRTGSCLGAERSQVQCIAAIQSALIRIEQQIAEVGQ